MESIQITYNDISLMIENSDTYKDMNEIEKSEFLIEFFSRYDIGRL